ncbi:MAG: hypothetical protein ACLP50_06790 [Solirubrobacteraceae bacterium]
MPDTTTKVKAILARTLRELEQVINNADITSFLRGLGSVLGLEQDGATATTKPTSRRAATAKPKRVTAPRASTARASRLPEAKTAEAKARTRTPPKPKAASTARANSGAPRARTGARRDQLLALVADQPGITLAQAAKQFGLKDATGLYAVARRLQDDGLVQKSGVELHPTAKAKPNNRRG